MECHACGGKLLEPVLELGNIPLVDKYMLEEKEALNVESSPLSLCQCEFCKTYQINKIVEPKKLYSNYIYASTSSPDLSNHFNEYIDFISNQKKFSKDISILEIGGNDGLLLRKLNEKGFRNLSVIDPAPQVSNCKEFANVYQQYFGSNQCEELLNKNEAVFDLIIANNCLAHIPNLSSIFKSIFKRLKKDGKLIFEVNSLYHMVVNDVFDYIYHEHIFYHSITSLRKLLSLAEIYINDVKFVVTKGGSFRITCSKINIQNDSVNYWELKEFSLGLHQINPLIFEYMNLYIPFLKNSLHKLVSEKKFNRLFLFGACATTTVLIEALDLAKISYGIIDDNIHRQKRFSPGRGLSVYPKTILEKDDLVINTAWRHQKKIKDSLKDSKLKNIVIPIPYPKIEHI